MKQANQPRVRLILLRKALIVEALLDLQRQSCFKFVKRTMEDDYISIEPLDGCYSYVGRIGTFLLQENIEMTGSFMHYNIRRVMFFRQQAVPVVFAGDFRSVELIIIILLTSTF